MELAIVSLYCTKLETSLDSCISATCCCLLLQSLLLSIVSLLSQFASYWKWVNAVEAESLLAGRVHS